MRIVHGGIAGIPAGVTETERVMHPLILDTIAHDHHDRLLAAARRRRLASQRAKPRRLPVAGRTPEAA